MLDITTSHKTTLTTNIRLTCMLHVPTYRQDRRRKIIAAVSRAIKITAGITVKEARETVLLHSPWLTGFIWLATTRARAFIYTI